MKANGVEIAEKWKEVYQQCAEFLAYPGEPSTKPIEWCVRLIEELSCAEEEAKQNALMVIRQGEKLDRLRWKPITPENLPKVGDEVGRYLRIRGKYAKFSGNWTVMSVIESMRDWDLSAWSEFRSWTHFRPQSPPIQTQEAH